MQTNEITGAAVTSSMHLYSLTRVSVQHVALQARNQTSDPVPTSLTTHDYNTGSYPLWRSRGEEGFKPPASQAFSKQYIYFFFISGSMSQLF